MSSAFVNGTCTTCELKNVPVNPETLLCANCSICEYCSTHFIITKGNPRCTTCRCQECGKYEGLNLIQDPRIQLKRQMLPTYLCIRCTQKIMPNYYCKHCKERVSELKRRGDRTPSVCARCIFSGNPDLNKTHYCWFCNTPATDQNNLKLVCNTHAKIPFCNNCTPLAPCKSCIKKAEELNTSLPNLMLQKLEVAKLHRHPGQPPSDAHILTCPGCNWLAQPWINTREVKFHEAIKPSQRRTNKSQRLAAVEIEASTITCWTASRRIREVAEKWNASVVKDGSIPSGLEINTAPASGDLIAQQINEFKTALDAAGAKVDDHCGLHVHIDMRDHTYPDLLKFMHFYARIEPALIRTQPAKRVWLGKYCRPCARYYVQKLTETPPIKSLKAEIISSLYGPDKKKPPRGHKYENARYSFINPHSWFMRGTIECRGHSGTLVVRKIVDWTMLWQSIVDTAYKMSLKDIIAIKDQPLNLLLSIAPNDSIRQYIKARTTSYGSSHDIYEKQANALPPVAPGPNNPWQNLHPGAWATLNTEQDLITTTIQNQTTAEADNVYYAPPFQTDPDED